MSNTKIEDSIISAVEILTERAISQAGFDKTIQGTIKRCENKAAGQYVIKYQDSTFYAYAASPDITYNNNTLVYVQIPQGDFKNTKTILGTVKKLGSDYITMLNEDEAYDVIGQNIFILKDTFAIQTYEAEPYIQSFDLNDSLLTSDEYTSYIKESKYLQIKAKIKSQIADEQSEGNYCLSIKMIFDDKAGQEVEREYRLGASQVVGNPYHISAPTIQSAIYSIDGENFKRFSSISLIKDGFISDSSKVIDDIWYSNIEICAVEPLIFAGDGKLSLSIITPSGRIVNNGYPNELNLEASLKSNGAVYTSKAEYMWFIEDGRTATGDNYSFYAGYGWKRLNSASNILTVSADDIVAKTVRYRCIAIVDDIVLSKIIILQNLNPQYQLEIHSDNGTEFFLDTGEFSLSATLTKIQNQTAVGGSISNESISYDTYWYSMDSKGFYESVTNLNNIQVNTIEGFKKYYCVVYINNNFVASADITITNAAQGAGYTIVIRNGDKVYKYDEKGISPCSDSKQTPMRIPELSFEVYNPNGKLCFDSTSAVGGNKITWMIPAEDSLIEPNLTSAEKNNYLSDDGQNYLFTTGTLEYKISNYYKATRTRKQIQLIVNYNGNILTATTNFTFTKEGGNGTNGTSYSIVIYENNRTDNSIQLGFKKYKDGELVSNDETGLFTDWKWYNLKLTSSQLSDLVISDQSAENPIISWNSFTLDSADIIKLECKAPDGYYIYSYYCVQRYNIADIKIIGGPGDILFNTDLSSCDYDDDVFEVIDSESFGSNIQILWGLRPDNGEPDHNPTGVLTFGDSNIGKTFMPRIRKTYDGSTNNAVICRIYNTDDNTLLAEKKIPIYIGVNRYSNSALNGWDGSSVQIDKDGKQYILAPQIGAGIKNSDNSFTGVIMGTQKNTSDNTNKTGLFGYGAGEETVFINASTGLLKAKNATIEGEITASTGKIGAWEITDKKYLKSGEVWLHPEGASARINNVQRNEIVFKAGSKFGVAKDGTLYANGANIDGTITATGGSIGGFTIDSKMLKSLSGDSGIWIHPEGTSSDVFGYLPYGGVAVGKSGEGLFCLSHKGLQWYTGDRVLTLTSNNIWY